MKRIASLLVLLLALAGGGYFAYSISQSAYNALLFNTAAWAIPIVVLLGVFLGATIRREKSKISSGKVLRHSWSSPFYHWSFAISGIALIITGIYAGFLFIPRIANDPQSISLIYNIHFVGSLFFLFGMSAHVTDGYVTGKIKEHLPESKDFGDALVHYTSKIGLSAHPREGKYLASERLSYVMWLIFIGLIVITGFFKAAAHVWDIPGGIMGAATFIHDVSALAMAVLLVVHVLLGAVVPWSWQLLRSMITGYVSEKYVEKNHPVWHEELKGQK
jgi:formate dehydrogenase subunit gamma